MSGRLIEIAKEEQFDKTLEENEYVFVDFFAPWCGPCRMVLPTVEEVANEMLNVAFMKINVDNLPEIAARYGVSGIPRFVFFKSGQPIDSLTGARPKNQIVDFIQKNIA